MAYRLTAEMLNTMCQEGLTVGEMATRISAEAGTKVSVNAIKGACQHYNISLRTKPRKSVLALDPVDVVEAPAEVGSLEMA